MKNSHSMKTVLYSSSRKIIIVHLIQLNNPKVINMYHDWNKLKFRQNMMENNLKAVNVYSKIILIEPFTRQCSISIENFAITILWLHLLKATISIASGKMLQNFFHISYKNVFSISYFYRNKFWKLSSPTNLLLTRLFIFNKPADETWNFVLVVLIKRTWNYYLYCKDRYPKLWY